MPKRDVSSADQRVLVTLPSPELEALEALTADRDLHHVAPADNVRRALDLQPRVIVVADPDAVRGLRAVQRLRSANACWSATSSNSGDARTVDVRVRWLRSKIEPDPHDPVWLLTVRGAGYRLETVPLTKR